MTDNCIRKAIVPAAGFGTRLRPLTNAIPKEMLPIGRKPVLQHVIEELRECRIREALIVVSPGKDIIRKYFDDGEKFGVSIQYVLQNEMRGLGDAVLQGEEWAGGEHFAVAFGDCIIESKGQPPLMRLLETHILENSAATVLAEAISLEQSSKYGILDPADDRFGAAGFPLKGIVEKPSPPNAPSNLAVAARWALSSSIFEYIRKAPSGQDGEINLTDPIRAMMRSGAAAWGVPLLAGEARRDIGGWDSYLYAAAEAAILDDEFGDSLRARLCSNNQNELGK